MTIPRLQELINLTHKHGIALEAEIKHLQNVKPTGWGRQVFVKRSLLGVLKALNVKRRIELAVLEHRPPPPKPHPQQRFTMYDAVDPGTGLPERHPAAVAGYINGKYQSFLALVKRYPNAKHLSISVFVADAGRCLDIETGDASPSDAPGWVRKRHAAGITRPIVYANTSTMPQVLAALAHSGIRRNEYLVWTAHYTGVPHIEQGSDATQYRNVEAPGRNYDVSLCEPWFL